MTKHFKRIDLQDVCYIVKTTFYAIDGSLQTVTSLAPLYMLDDYAKVSRKSKILFDSLASMERTITFRILNGPNYFWSNPVKMSSRRKCLKT